jgi:integrase
MAKVSILPWTGKEDENRRMPIYLVVRHRGERATMSLGARLRRKQWNKRREKVRKSHADYADINDLLSRARRLAESAIAARRAKEGKTLTAKAVRDEVRESLRPEPDEENGKPEAEDFLAHALNIVERYHARGQIATAKAYRAALNKLKTFLRQDEKFQRGRSLRNGTLRVPFEEVDPALLERYRTWELNERGNKKNTVHKTFSALRRFCNLAIKEGPMSQADYPFRHVELSREKTSKHQWLRKKELQALSDIEPTRGTQKVDALNIFLFQYYAWGMRIGDALYLKWKNLYFGEGRLRYQMGKTGAHLDLPLTPKAQAIVERYRKRESPGAHVFPWMDRYDLSTADERTNKKESRTAKVNQHLSDFKEQLVEAGDLPERRKLSTHTARHSAACQMYIAWKDLYRIKRYLGHESVTQTEKYLRSMDGLTLGEDGDWNGVL